MVFWDRKNWGKVTAKAYRDRIVLAHLLPLYHRERPFWGSPLMIMEDNSWVHNAPIREEVRNTHLLPRLPWPAVSPDLNPIEEFWRRMKEELSSLTTRPSTKEAMEDAIWAVWVQHDNSEIQAIVDSMPLRIQDVLAAQGGHTHIYSFFSFSFLVSCYFTIIFIVIYTAGHSHFLYYFCICNWFLLGFGLFS